jgi:hypothetical protein
MHWEGEKKGGIYVGEEMSFVGLAKRGQEGVKEKFPSVTAFYWKHACPNPKFPFIMTVALFTTSQF